MSATITSVTPATSLSGAERTSLASVSSASVQASLSSAFASLASESKALASASAIAAGSESTPASYKVIGLVLALASGLFIGCSFVFKKKGLLNSQKAAAAKGYAAGEGHEYLKSPMWWSGMSLMIVGEICNFVAYAFADAILITPMGALSVVICAVLSSIFLKERLSFFGKVGCFLCVVGATIIAINAPEEQAVSTIAGFQRLFLAPGFLAFGSVVIAGALFLVFWVGPRYGKKSMLVYISICSIIGGLSVVSTQGLGASIVTTIKGDNQFKHWFMYFLLGFVAITLSVEINFLNKALELFNTALVTPTYYVMFTFSTLVTSIVLFQGLKAPAMSIVTLVLGFLVICAGITLLQMSKVDPAEIKGLDRRSTILLQAVSEKATEDEKGLDIEDPGMDGLRGFGGIVGSIRRSRTARQSIASQSELRARQELRRRRQDSIIEEARVRRGNDLEMGGGMSRHQLWDAPMPDDALDRISMHSGIPRSATLRSVSNYQQTQIQGSDVPPSLPRIRAASIHFDSKDTQGHDRPTTNYPHSPSLPARESSFPTVQPFTPPDDSHQNNLPSLRLVHTPQDGRFLDESKNVVDPYGSYSETAPTGVGSTRRTEPTLAEMLSGTMGHSSSAFNHPLPPVRQARSRAATNESQASGRSRSGSKSRLPLSPRGLLHGRRGAAADEGELQSLVGGPNSGDTPESSDEGDSAEEAGSADLSLSSDLTVLGPSIRPVRHVSQGSA